MGTTINDEGEEKSFREALITDQELNECDSIPLHLLGSVQGDESGHVVFITYPEANIVAVDANIFQVSFVSRVGGTSAAADAGGGADVKAMVGSPLSEWVPGAVLQRFLSAIQDMVRSSSERGFSFLAENSTYYSISLSTTQTDFGIVSLEIEQVPDEQVDKSFHNTLMYLSKVLDLHSNDKAAKKACDVMFDLLEAYDRGMVYRFNDDLSGEIIHEIRRPKLESSYLGMCFPASDIPQSARNLYRKNVLRYIRDSGAPDVPVLSAEDRPIDLTQVRSRACHKAHLIYMRNMGVVCSMSLAIIVDNDLWGLLVFHGYTKPFKPSLHMRIACETITSMVSARAETLLKKSQSARIVEMGEALLRWKQGASLKVNLETVGESVLRMTEADVLVALVENPVNSELQTVVVGDETLVPGDAFWEVLRTRPNRELCQKSTRQGIADMGLTEQDCPAAGFCYFHEGRTQVMLGRAWRSRDVKWAGSPDKPKLRIGGMLNPRHSFETHLQKARKESRAWNPSDQLIVSILKDRVCAEHCHNWIVNLLHNDIEEANLRYFNEIERAEDNSNFFAGMCHELRTPFHGVIGCLNIIHDSFDEMRPEEIKDLVSTALSSGYHMINLLNDLLNKSKNKYLSTESFVDTVELSAIAQDSTRGMKSLAKNLNLSLNCEVLPSEPKIYFVTDRTKVIQIVTNIVNNAIKFSGKNATVDVRFELVGSIEEATDLWEKGASQYEGSVFSIRGGEMLDSIDAVRSTSFSVMDKEEQKWLCIAVADSGVGMKPDELADMFEPYTQAQINKSRVLQGTGLGLFICATLSQQLRGFLSCSSTPGEGTVFQIGFPVVMTGAPQEEADEVSEEVAKDIPVTGPILICDDNKVNVKILSRALHVQFQKTGVNLKLITADGGAEAVELFKKELPSVLIIDYHMPEVDGIEATERIRKFEAARGLLPSYIVSYTADASDAAKQKLLGSGANEIMAKPPPRDFLPNLVRRFFIESKKAPSIHS